MRKSQKGEAGVFNPRLFLAFTFTCFAGMLALVSFAASPTSGTLTDTSGPITYTAGPFNQPNQSPVGLGQLDTGPRCDDSGAFPCDTYHLAVTLPAGYMAAHPNAAIKASMSWTDAGTGQADYDLYIYKLPRNDCASATGTPSPDCSMTDGFESADAQSASGANPEVATFSGHDGTVNYTVHIVPFQPTGETVTVKIELLPGAAPTGGGGPTNFGGADATVPNQPRFMNFYAPAGTSAESGSGEFNIGYNPATHRIMVMNAGPIWRLTLPEYLAQAKPECCEAFWEDKDNPATNTGLDPILWTDQKSGRTFSSNSTVGANAIYGYSDDDGDNWIPFGVAAPNGGADHETIGTGPYPALLSNLVTPLNQGEATYYCSQDIVGPASCYRSDTLGSTYGPGVLAYNGQGTGVPGGTDCGGLHGHIHVAPDGTAWLPVNQCGGLQGGAFSVDGGMTWHEFKVPNAFSQPNGADPSIGIDKDNNIYYAYVRNEPVGNGNPPEGHARVATGKLVVTGTFPLQTFTINWTHDVDLGRAAVNGDKGIVNAAQIEATQGGDSGRCGVGFIGTNLPGDYQAGAFPGNWYVFISTTYDGGATWTTVNATPNDPVQHATGVWQQGGSGQNGDRNLLDFNEITIGDKGQVLYGYSDGCVTSGCVNQTSGNDKVAFMRVARQTGGRSLYAAFDQQEPIAPKAACLSGTRDASGSYLSWKVPDNGGAVITAYQIFRSTTAGTETQIATFNVAPNSKPEYVDTTADPSVPDYFYKIVAVNSANAGVPSNEIDLKLVIPPLPQSPCTLPGVTVLTDATGDSLSPQPGTDMVSASIAQPFAANGVMKFVFTLKTDPAVVASQPPGSAWYLAMQVPNGSGGTRYTGVRMEGGATNSFYSYVPGANNSGGVDGRFVTSKKAADPASNYNSATGTITIVVSASDLGLNPGDKITGFVAGSSQSTDVAGVGAGASEVYDPMPDSLSFANSYTVQPNYTCSPMLPTVVSRKTHGSAGDFDINLPASGGPGIESRGPTGGGYTLLFTFPAATTIGSASVSSGNATVQSSNTSGDGRTYTLQLATTADVQDVTVQLSNLSDTAGNSLTTLPFTMRILVGDVNADGVVNSADATITRNVSGHLVDASNFRADFNVDGVVNSADATIVRARSGHSVGGTADGAVSRRGQ